jgi:hypothetical protein
VLATAPAFCFLVGKFPLSGGKNFRGRHFMPNVHGAEYQLNQAISDT